ncbi:YkgJ family cysteine cluster protein [Methanoregula sp.]|uniref:YkgJ family cysteine cluster protein n=1 Tax=Methanoregula sp. TaxID=2052170 RepID=UPI000CADDFB7|nr:YkgJ family cysteine cluster protein [Methanoregula sp.]PKG33241.1 MAG: YkgJ family cysteine cluster protein [Methanoregula sp.]
MTDDWMTRAEAICMHCGGHCCNGAQPPISGDCYRRLIAQGVPDAVFGQEGYRFVKTRDEGTCMLCKAGKCSIHAIKPETCIAGPFTFDVTGDTIGIFLKYETICPLVRLLKEFPEAYDRQYAAAVRSITRLVMDLRENELAAICQIEEPDTEKVAEIPRVYPVQHDDRH